MEGLTIKNSAETHNSGVSPKHQYQFREAPFWDVLNGSSDSNPVASRVPANDAVTAPSGTAPSG